MILAREIMVNWETRHRFKRLAVLIQQDLRAKIGDNCARLNGRKFFLQLRLYPAREEPEQIRQPV